MTTVDGFWSADPDSDFKLGKLSFSVRYCGTPDGWLTEWWARRRGDMYVVGANSDIKRCEDVHTGSFSGPAGFGVSATIVLSGEPFRSAEVRFFFPKERYYSLWSWDYRYGPTWVLVPVSEILSDGEDVDLIERDYD